MALLSAMIPEVRVKRKKMFFIQMWAQGNGPAIRCAHGAQGRLEKIYSLFIISFVQSVSAVDQRSKKLST
jgi:hypothetical protein